MKQAGRPFSGAGLPAVPCRYLFLQSGKLIYVIEVTIMHMPGGLHNIHLRFLLTLLWFPVCSHSLIF